MESTSEPASSPSLDVGVRPAGEVWPEPFDLFEHANPGDLATPPDRAIPPGIDAWVRGRARLAGVPIAFALGSALAVLAAAIGNSLRIQPRHHNCLWTEPAALGVVLVAPPGTGKSPIINAAVEPLRALDNEEGRADEAVHADWAEGEKRRKKKGNEDLSPQPEPPRRRRVIDNVTMEKQIRIHADNPRGLLRITDEFLSMMDALGAYKKGGGGDRSQLLRVLDGGGIIVDRVGSGTIRAEAALMSFIAGTQPAKLSTLARDLGSDGLMQRILFFSDDGGRRDYPDEPLNVAIDSAWDEMVRGLANASYPHSKPAVQLSEEARAILNRARDKAVSLADLPGSSSEWQGHVAKWDRIIWRLALIVHCVDQWTALGKVDHHAEVSAETAHQVAKLTGFFLRHGWVVYRKYYSPDLDKKEALEIADLLLARSEMDIVTHRDLYQAKASLKGAQQDRQRIAIMTELENAGWCKVHETAAAGPRSWRINPLIHERFAGRAMFEKSRRAEEHARRAMARAAWNEAKNGHLQPQLPHLALAPGLFD